MNNNSAQNEHKAVDNASAATPNTSTINEPSNRYIPPHLREQTVQLDDYLNQRKDNVKKQTFEEVPVKALGDDVPNPIQRFGDLTLPPNLLAQIKKQYDRSPTPIQKHAMPVIMEGRDLVALAPTGSGKTLAYLGPIIAKMSQQSTKETDSADERGACQCLILVPAREIASAIYYEACKWTSGTNLKCCQMIGGVSIVDQLKTVAAGFDILVATPGRLCDMIDRGKVSMSKIKFLCLDEADHLLDMGFEPQIRNIVESKDMLAVGMRQTLIFSATYPKGVQKIVEDFLTDYIHLRVGAVGPRTTTQHFRYVEDIDKPSTLVDVLNGTTGPTLVFVGTKRSADKIEDYLLNGVGLPATCIHGDKSQAERETALLLFRSGERTILVCTDVSCRGLELPSVSHVINYDLPTNIDAYVYRMGRSIRRGKEGFLTSFFNEENKALAKDIVQLLQDSDQEVPAWLQEYVDPADRTPTAHTAQRYGGRGRASRGRGFGPSSTAAPRGGQRNNNNEHGDQQGNSWGGHERWI